MTVYEWKFEELDEYNDIVNVNHYGTLPELQRHRPHRRGHDICLVKSVWQDGGKLLSQECAYIYFNRLPSVFGGGSRIPVRFRKELVNNLSL